MNRPAAIAQRNPQGVNVLPKSPRQAAHTVIQRLTDKHGIKVTADRIDAESKIDTLREWQALDNEEWDSDEEDQLKARMGQRIATLQNALAQLAIEREKQALEQRAGVALPNFDAAVLQQLSGLSKGEQANFFKLCLQDGVTPSVIADGIIAAGNSQTSKNRGLAAFVGGASFGSAMRLAREYDDLVALRMNTVDVGQIVSLLDEGFLVARKITYCDTPLKSGSVYEFKISLTRDDWLTPEWHVHWGPQNSVEAASFKNVRMAVGMGVRVATGNVENAALKKALKNLWGP